MTPHPGREYESEEQPHGVAVDGALVSTGSPVEVGCGGWGRLNIDDRDVTFRAYRFKRADWLEDLAWDGFPWFGGVVSLSALRRRLPAEYAHLLKNPRRVALYPETISASAEGDAVDPVLSLWEVVASLRELQSTVLRRFGVDISSVIHELTFAILLEGCQDAGPEEGVGEKVKVDAEEAATRSALFPRHREGRSHAAGAASPVFTSTRLNI